ncbi:class I SAM-dependent methyltransferase [Methanoplanus endosymbiosus]|uniref:Class I SAM-dependent methyltransferase n=1 Tax=Methanoplanus endosymbiosus TaxID=33865 RepID=A0A9E7PL38_9EURY|nr:class I SAM-dependent methyltransferase [Methanoplanus endosymbiosus]UUX92165.1 class I SAM-dependent methyltransferase [Methanoplanus endosymbiosus]
MDKEEIIRFYDYVAEKEYSNWEAGDILLPVTEEFMKILPDNPEILDLGCGLGHEAAMFAGSGAKVTGIDFSRRSIETAREKVPECRFIEADFTDNPGITGKYDGIFSSGSLIHIPPEDFEKVIFRLAENLKEGGYFLIIYQEGEEKYTSHMEIKGEETERIIYRYRRTVIRKSFEDAGFSFEKDIRLPAGLIITNWCGLIFRKR